MEMDSPPWEQENCRSLFWDNCSFEEDFKGFHDDGFSYCSLCGCMHPNLRDMQIDSEDVYGRDGDGVGALYNVKYHRAKDRSSPPPYGFEGFLSSPQDFGTRGCKDPKSAISEIRLRYMPGLQLMLQQQCEALVDKLGVNALICGTAMTIWLRYVAVSGVLADGLVERMIDEAKVAGAAKSMENSSEKLETQKKIQSDLCMEQPKTFGQKVIYASLRSLRKRIPIYSTLAISFLSCHLAREAVLPTGIYKWVLEAKLPYLSAFVELEKKLGPCKFCPLSSRLLFRPTRVISASLLEATAASIAQTIGLRTPSVNFMLLLSVISKNFLCLWLRSFLKHVVCMNDLIHPSYGYLVVIMQFLLELM